MLRGVKLLLFHFVCCFIIHSGGELVQLVISCSMPSSLALSSVPSLSLLSPHNLQVKDYMEGSTVVWWSVSSTTSSLGVLQCPEFLGNSGARMIFTIDARHAVDIRRYSAIPDESEVLNRDASRFAFVAIFVCLNSCDFLHHTHFGLVFTVYSRLDASSCLVSDIGFCWFLRCVLCVVRGS